MNFIEYFVAILEGFLIASVVGVIYYLLIEVWHEYKWKRQMNKLKKHQKQMEELFKKQGKL